MREHEILRKHAEIEGYGRALSRFMEMTFVERVGWFFFGAKFLVWLWTKKRDAQVPVANQARVSR